MHKRRVRSAYAVPMVQHTFRILEVLSASSVALRLRDISARAHVGPTSTFRILQTLTRLGYIGRDMDGMKYRFTSKIRNLAGWSQLGPSIHQVAHPYLEDLRKQFNETVNLAVLEDGEIVYLEIVESSEAFRMSGTVGSRVPIHSAALGKAIVAHLPQEELAGILRHCPWTRFTRRTIINPGDFVAILSKVRRVGYACDDEESEYGASCIAVAIRRQSTGFAVAGISVSGPTARIRAKRRHIIEGLKKASDVIAQSLD